MEPNQQILDIVCNKWNLSSELTFIRKVENWIYKDNEKCVYVRITEPEHRSEEQLNSELDWIFYLGENGVKFAHANRSVDGNLVEEVKSEEHRFFVSVFDEAKGGHIKDLDDFTETRLKNWGKVIAKLHKTTLGYKPSEDIMKRDQWNEERNYKVIKELCRSEDRFYEKFNILDRYLQNLNKSNNEYNLIHADIHHGNFFVDENDQITVFDFDDCHYHWFVYDIAVPLFNIYMSLRFDTPKEKISKIQNTLVDGYKEVGQLSDNWYQRIDAFILYRNFIMYYWMQDKFDKPEFDDKDRLRKSMNACAEYIESFDYSLLER